MDLGWLTQQKGQRVTQCFIGNRTSVRHTFEFAAILRAPKPFEHAAGLHPGRVDGLRQGDMLVIADVCSLETQQGATAERLTQQPHLSSARVPDHHGGIDAGNRQLFGGLIAVAAIGDERQTISRCEHPPTRSGETREPAHVGTAGDQQCVEPGRCQGGSQCRRPR
ncbi:unannotated protein [freshwater metagenome]|uniref:Unannotated protein n=1 Tax=freshwater metagenome TaxID=449393 RepID=A0A6J7ER40_9ZZZZ